MNTEAPRSQDDTDLWKLIMSVKLPSELRDAESFGNNWNAQTTRGAIFNFGIQSALEKQHIEIKGK